MRTTIGNIKKMVATVVEARGRLTPQEVLTTYEDLYVSNNGQVSLEALASFLQSHPEDLKAMMPKAGLIVDRNGNVVERGMTPAPMKAVKL